MNKSDIKLLLVIIVITAISFSLLFVNKSNNGKNALVYYEDKLILKIDLGLNGQHEYKVKGYNGDIVIKTDNNKIRIIDENSLNHICRKQGWIENSYEVLVCLPNKVAIKIEDQEEIDTVVK